MFTDKRHLGSSPRKNNVFIKLFFFSFPQSLITQARTKQAATMSEVEWRGRSVPVKIDKARIFLLGLGDNEAAIAQVSQYFVTSYSLVLSKNKLHFIQCEAIDVSIPWYHSLQALIQINAELSLCVLQLKFFILHSCGFRGHIFKWCQECMAKILTIDYDYFKTILWSVNNQTRENYH